mmetsp:Transcript_16032/g.34730  ORF Transcript_16032/g.34730 Transcript_16032/m.34730 type:complete len:203 (-) Transcript_16032:123-731(-)
MVSTTNRSHTPATSTIPTIAKVKPRTRIPHQLRIRRTAHLTRDILNNVLPQQGLNVLGHVLPSDHETLITINTPLGTKLSHEELKHMLRTTLHHGTNLLKVDPQGLLRSHAGELGRLHGTTLLLDEIGVLSMKDAHDSIQHVFIGVFGLAVVHVVFFAVGGFAFEDEAALLGEFGVVVTVGGGCGFVLVLFGLFGPFLLLFA